MKCLTFLFIAATSGQYWKGMPIVPDKDTAVAIGKVIIARHHGQQYLKISEPWVAEKESSYWIIWGKAVAALNRDVHVRDIRLIIYEGDGRVAAIGPMSRKRASELIKALDAGKKQKPSLQEDLKGG